MDNSLRIFAGDFAERLPDEALKLDVLPVMILPENVQLRRIFNIDRKPFVKKGRDMLLPGFEGKMPFRVELRRADPIFRRSRRNFRKYNLIVRFAGMNSDNASRNNFICPVPGLQSADIILVANDSSHERIAG